MDLQVRILKQGPGNKVDPGLDNDDDENGTTIPNTEMTMQFCEYCRTHNDSFLPLTKQEGLLP